VLDPLDRILLFETRLAYTHAWLTPGGGVKAGESFAEAARRELWEEVGVRDFELGPCVWTLRFSFEHRGEVVDQREQYFVARLDSSEVVDANREAKERAEILRHRWWTGAELHGADASFRPRELPTLFPAVVSGDVPRNPIPCSVEVAARVV